MGKKIYDVETQFLTICEAKIAGLNSEGLVDFVPNFSEGTADVTAYGLLPILVYSLVVPAFGAYSRVLVDARAPIPISEFLSFVWSDDQGLGLPIALEVKKRLADADKGFMNWLEQENITVVTGQNTKSIVAFERASLDVSPIVHTWGRRDEPERPLTIEEASSRIKDYDRLNRLEGGLKTSMEHHQAQTWADRPKRFSRSVPIPNDWTLPPVNPRTTIKPIFRSRSYHGPVIDIGPIAEMWPGGRKKLLADLDISATEFGLWVQGHGTLTYTAIHAIRKALNLSYNETYDEWEMEGGNLLIATTKRQVGAIYDKLSHGGDLLCSFEILGPQGEYPFCRFLYFEAQGGNGNIILFDRYSSAVAALEGDYLINLADPVIAPLAVWDQVTTIVANRLYYDTPGEVGLAFSQVHRAWLDANSAF